MSMVTLNELKKGTAATAHGADVAQSPKFYFPELDGLRLVAFLLVFFHHAMMPNLSLLGPGALARGVSITTIEINGNGWVGVDLFFVISGFLITSILRKERQKSGDVSLKRFYQRRALRIFPVYFLFLFADAIMASVLPEEHRFNVVGSLLAFATFVGNFAMSFAAIKYLVSYSALWSVCIEEQFYLAWGWILKRVGGTERLLTLVSWAYAINVVLRTALVLMHVGSHRQFYFNTFTHLDGLLCGVMLALTYDKWMPVLSQEKQLTKILQGLSWLIVFSALIATSSKGILMTLMPPLWALVVCTAIAGKSDLLSHRVVVALGRRTYAMYVVQVACFVYINELIMKWFPDWSAFAWIPVLAGIMLLAELSWRFIETPCLRKKERYAVVATGAVITK